jgi:hypothetical protein
MTKVETYTSLVPVLNQINLIQTITYIFKDIYFESLQTGFSLSGSPNTILDAFITSPMFLVFHDLPINN